MSKKLRKHAKNIWNFLSAKYHCFQLFTTNEKMKKQ